MSEVNNAILKKVKGLLAIANDAGNDNESQSALLMAQRLMLKHGIGMKDLNEEKKRIEIL